MSTLPVDRIIERVFKAAGSKSALASHLGLNRQALDYWRRIPAHHVIPIERFINKKVTRYQMRPDLYPDDMPTQLWMGNEF